MEKDIIKIKEELNALEDKYEDDKLKLISKLQGEFRYNTNMTQIIKIISIDGDYLKCFRVKTVGDGDLYFEKVNISIMDYLNDYEFDKDREGKGIIKSILYRISKDFGIDK